MIDMKHLIEQHFKSITLGNEQSILELDLIDSGEFPPYQKTECPKWWDKDSKIFLNHYKKDNTLPIERFYSWKNLTIDYMDSHSFVFPSLSEKAYSYYLSFFLWSYTFNSNNLFKSKNYFLFWLYTLNPFDESTMLYDRVFINRFKTLTKQQFRITRIMIYRIMNDKKISESEKNIINDAYYTFWCNVDYDNLHEYLD